MRRLPPPADEAATRPGKVWLVGAGPGDPELLTLRALRLIQTAEVIVYDQLVGEEILLLAHPQAELLFAGKRAGRHSLPQSEINALLLEQARRGRMVVRLKGGDPGIFGCAGEEMEHLARHEIEVGLVPGVTAALGCAAAAGIPLTLRGSARSLHLVTGHCQAGDGLDLDWDRLADPEGTLVLYMGRRNLPALVGHLIAAGLPAETPAVAIENGTLPDERRRLATLGTLPAMAEDLGRGGPVLLIIGEVVGFAAWVQRQAAAAEGMAEEESEALAVVQH